MQTQPIDVTVRGKQGGGGSEGGKQVVNTWRGGRLPVEYSRHITTTQLQRGSDATRGRACRPVTCVNNCEIYSDLRACKYAVRLVYCEMIVNSCRMCEFVLQRDKVSQLTLYVRIGRWEHCDGSKYFSCVTNAAMPVHGKLKIELLAINVNSLNVSTMDSRNSKNLLKIEGITSKKADVIFISDVRAKDKGEELKKLFNMSKNGSYRLYLNSTKESRGVAIAIKRGIFHEIRCTIIDRDNENYILLDANFKGHNVVLGGAA